MAFLATSTLRFIYGGLIKMVVTVTTVISIKDTLFSSIRKRYKLFLYIWRRSYKLWIKRYKDFLKFSTDKKELPRRGLYNLLVQIRGFALKNNFLVNSRSVISVFYSLSTPYITIKDIFYYTRSAIMSSYDKYNHYKVFKLLKGSSKNKIMNSDYDLPSKLLNHSAQLYLHLDSSRLIKNLYHVRLRKIGKKGSSSSIFKKVQFSNSSLNRYNSVDFNPIYVRNYFPYTFFPTTPEHYYTQSHLNYVDDVFPLGSDLLELESYNDLVDENRMLIQPYAASFWDMNLASNYVIFRRWLKEVGWFGERFKPMEMFSSFQTFQRLDDIETFREKFFTRDPIVFLSNENEYDSLSKTLDRPNLSFDIADNFKFFRSEEKYGKKFWWTAKDYFNSLETNWYRMPQNEDFTYAIRDMSIITLTLLFVIILISAISYDFVFYKHLGPVAFYNYDLYRPRAWTSKPYGIGMFKTYHTYWPFIYQRYPSLFQSPYEWFMFERTFKGKYHEVVHTLTALFLPYGLFMWVRKFTNALPHFDVEYIAAIRKPLAIEMALEQQYTRYKSIDSRLVIEDIIAQKHSDYYWSGLGYYFAKFSDFISVHNWIVYMWLFMLLIALFYVIIYMLNFFTTNSWKGSHFYMLVKHNYVVRSFENFFLKEGSYAINPFNRYIKFISVSLSSKVSNIFFRYDNLVRDNGFISYYEQCVYPALYELSGFKVHYTMYNKEFFFLPEFRELNSYFNWISWYDEIRYVDSMETMSYLVDEGDDEYEVMAEDVGSDYQFLTSSITENVKFITASPLYSLYSNQLESKYFSYLMKNRFIEGGTSLKRLKSKLLKNSSKQWLYDNYELFYPNSKISPYTYFTFDIGAESETYLFNFTDEYDNRRFLYSGALLKLRFYEMYYLYNFHKRLRHLNQKFLNGLASISRGEGYLSGGLYRFYNPRRKSLSEFNLRFMHKFFMSEERMYLNNTLSYIYSSEVSPQEEGYDFDFGVWMESATSLKMGNEMVSDSTYLLDSPIFEVEKSEIPHPIEGRIPLKTLTYDIKLNIADVYWSKDNMLTWYPSIRVGEQDNIDYLRFSEFVPLFSYLFNQFEEWRSGGFYSSEDWLIRRSYLTIWPDDKRSYFPGFVVHSRRQASLIGAWPYGLDYSNPGKYVFMEKSLMKSAAKVGAGMEAVDFEDGELTGSFGLHYEESLHYSIRGSMRRAMRYYDDFDIMQNQQSDYDLGDFHIMTQWLSQDLLWYSSGEDVYNGYESWL
jgi:hypothetical protein